MDKVPQIYPPDFYYQQINRLTPSSYIDTESNCYMRYVLSRAARHGERLYSNFNSIYGRVAHELFYLRKRGLIGSRLDFKAKWKELLQVEENKLIKQYPSLKNIQLANFQLCNDCWKIAERIVPTNSNESANSCSNMPKFGSEFKVSLDDLIIGYIDSVVPMGNGAEIIDYKTGKVYDENGCIKQAYVTQLNLYSVIYEYQFGVPVKKLTIIDRDGSNIDVPQLNLTADVVRSEASQKISRINRLICAKQVAELSILDEDCKFCECRHICKVFLETATPCQILKGTVSCVPNKNVIELQTDKYGKIIINNFDTINLDLEELSGETLLFVNLYQPDEDRPFSICKNTFIFKEVDNND